MHGVGQKLAMREDSSSFTNKGKPLQLQTAGRAHSDRVAFMPEIGLDCPSPLPTQERYVLSEFLIYEDEFFLINAYRAIIGRAPDPEGSAPYLQGLRTGVMSKVDILGRLRLSKEGRRMNVTIKGLLLPFTWHTVCHTPVLGYVLRLMEGLATLPALMREQRVLAARQRRLQARLEGTTEQLKIALIGQFQDNGQDWTTGHSAHAESMGRDSCQHDHFAPPSRTHQPNTASTPDNGSTGLTADMYAAFEKRFRGTREDIAHLFRVYLPWLLQIAPDRPILDLGCGRGELLELLDQHGKAVLGVDLNPFFLAECQRQGLRVVQQDVLKLLQSQPTTSIGAVTAMHLIEHLPCQTLVTMYQEIYRVLIPGGIAIIESPNPENLQVGACLFYLDPTHRAPIPPATTEHLLLACGFSHVETLRLHPVESGSIPEKLRQPALSPLKQLLYGPQDYAVIVRKGE